MSMLEQLTSTDPPWIHLLILKEAQTVREVIPELPGFTVREIDGQKCRTKPDLIAEFGRVLNFPSYCGSNWDAFEECVTDLEWLVAKGYLILITQAHNLLAGQEDEFHIFIDILQEAGKTWSTPQYDEWPRPAIPFHVLLVVGAAEATKVAKWNVPRLEAA